MKTKHIVLLLLLSLLMVSCSRYHVYSMRDKPLFPVSGGVLYALPKTQICLSLTLERRDVSNAPYRDFAVELLGVEADDIDSSFRISDINVSTRNVADVDNYFLVKVKRGSVTVDQRHLLLAIGMTNPSNNRMDNSDLPSRPQNGRLNPDAGNNLYDRADTLYSRYDKPGNPTMISERKDSRSLRQRAVAAAERLGEIQSKRQELLNGEYEGSYSLEALNYINGQLAKQEEEIVSRFCGVVRRETVRFYVEPSFKKNDEVIDTVVWFSPSMGLVGDIYNLPDDATPVVCRVTNDNELRNANRFVKYHTSGVTPDGKGGRSGNAYAKQRRGKGFRYRVPESATVMVTTDAISVKRQVKMAQLGPIMMLPARGTRALFDANNLMILNCKR